MQGSTQNVKPRVLVITGAGISAESGIPTFRGAGGLWEKFDAARLATPEAFAEDPALVWHWYRERRAGVCRAEPNAAHRAVAEIERRARDFLLVTQNVDDLHERGGVSPERLVHIHGEILVSRCTHCHQETRVKDDDPDAELPRCAACGALLRPGVVWFGELLPEMEVARVERFLKAGPCDLVLVIGTTAAFYYILDWAERAAGRHGWLAEINPEETPLSPLARLSLREPAAVALPRFIREHPQFFEQGA